MCRYGIGCRKTIGRFLVASGGCSSSSAVATAAEAMKFPMQSAGRNGPTETGCFLLRRDSAMTATGNLRHGPVGLLSPH